MEHPAHQQNERPFLSKRSNMEATNSKSIERKQLKMPLRGEDAGRRVTPAHKRGFN